jgi:hypothetical protein
MNSKNDPLLLLRKSVFNRIGISLETIRGRFRADFVKRRATGPRAWFQGTVGKGRVISMRSIHEASHAVACGVEPLPRQAVFLPTHTTEV